jgi:aminotransferase in exopolysaccharide biosynthesis
MPDYSIPLSVPSIRGNEWQYVKECLDTGWVSSAGKYVDLFEEKIADYTGAKYAVSCVNGTSALQVSLRLAGARPGDEVIVPTLTFIAPVNAVAYNNASPLFMDADEYYNIDVEKTIEFINKETVFKGGFTYNKSTNKKITAIIPVHVWGNAARLDELIPLCLERNIAVVEDNSESMGTFYKEGKYEGKHTGTIGQLGCLSFNGNKIITTGGGGMILTDDADLAEKAQYLTKQAKDDRIRYIHNEIGYNFRLTNIQSALGVAQLEQLPGFLERKREIYFQYQAALNGQDGLTIADVPDYADNNHWMNLLYINSKTFYKNIEQIMEQLRKNGIQTRPVWNLNHLQNPFINFQNYTINKAKELLAKSLCLPSSTNLNNQNLKDITNLLY